MKWPIKNLIGNDGDYRYVEKFAWFPVKCEGPSYPEHLTPHTYYRVWLEHYIQTQKYERVLVSEFEAHWWEYQWVPKANSIISKDKK